MGPIFSFLPMPLMIAALTLCEVASLAALLGICTLIKKIVDKVTGTPTGHYNSMTYPSEMEFRCM
ncbi:hypothetical protein [Atopobium fossor]|uniref:hypothetical protein n=1 Tax=Atopobium fossor TaxID=39487 RepID=UPI0004205E62|nr:hypothetical protein [Atopobium fossor]